MFFNSKLSICFLIVSVFSAMISYSFIHCEHTFLHVHKYSCDSYFKPFAGFNIRVILRLFTVVFSFYLGSCSLFTYMSVIFGLDPGHCGQPGFCYVLLKSIGFLFQRAATLAGFRLHSPSSPCWTEAHCPVLWGLAGLLVESAHSRVDQGSAWGWGFAYPRRCSLSLLCPEGQPLSPSVPLIRLQGSCAQHGRGLAQYPAVWVLSGPSGAVSHTLSGGLGPLWEGWSD